MLKASDQDIARVTELLGRRPQGDFEVVVRDITGDPVVVKNEPLLFDGTPMPTRFWLVGSQPHLLVSRLESAGWIDLAESEVDAQELAQTHMLYAIERDSQIPADHVGPRPHGGVAGTRTGVKCLHAHYAHWLAGGKDVVGDWVAKRLAI
jgi:hypothetical protein